MSVSNEQNNQQDNDQVAVDENHVIAERREKLKALRSSSLSQGSVAFPNDFKPKDKAADLLAAPARQLRMTWAQGFRTSNAPTPRLLPTLAEGEPYGVKS